MNITNTTQGVNLIQCPVCANPLDINDLGLSCEQGHQFDYSRQGYYNLLLVQHKKSKNPGDDKNMVTARTKFLELKRYQPLADAIQHTCQKFWPDVQSWVDIGCGEGWYTRQVLEKLPGTQGYGLDISKFAVQAACKRSQKITWLVGSANRLPFFSNSMEGALVLFSRIMPDEIIRVLKPGGILITAGTGPDHLIQLRQLLYPEVNQRVFDARDQLPPQFEGLYDKEISFEWIADSEDELNDLLTMTPHHWRISPQQRHRLPELINQTLTGQFRLQAWEFTG